MDSGLLSLKWNNHSSTFFHVLETIRKKELYSDVTIACDGKFFSVHKLVLSTCSEYFQEMFERTQCKHPIIVLKDINHKDLESLLNYMYIGEVNVIQTELSSLIKAAECLKVKGLAVPDEPPASNRKASKRPSVGDREEGSSIHKRNRRSAPLNFTQNPLHSSPQHDRGNADNVPASPNLESDPRDNVEKDKRLRAEEQSSSTHNFKPFEPITVKSEKEDPVPEETFVPDDTFVPDELPPVAKYEFDGSPVDSTMSSGLEDGNNESSYQSHLQQPSEESMSHLIPSTSRYGESSTWPGEIEGLEKDKEGGGGGGGGGGEAGNYEPNPFLLDNPQAKAPMAPFSYEVQNITYPSEPISDMTLRYMRREESMWKCVYPGCSYQDYYKTNVLRHVRNHTGEKPFACHVCLYRFGTKSNLQRHIHKKHVLS